jgi:hypothetical protein
MTGRRVRTPAPVAAASILALAALSAPVEPIQVTPLVTDGQVVVSFTAPTSYGQEVQETVQSGLLVTFTFGVELRRPSTVWVDQTLGTATVASSVKFDNLTGVYQVSKLKEGRVIWSERTEDGKRVRTWMTTFERVPVASRQPLEPNADYYIRVRMHSSPKRTFSLWPWSGDAASGRAEFTFIR